MLLARKILSLIILILVVFIRNSALGQEKGSLEGAKGTVNAVAFSANGEWVATGDCYQKVIVWDVRSKMIITTFTSNSFCKTSVAFSPDSQLLAASSIDKTVRLWKTGSWKERAIFQGPNSFTALAFSHDGKTLAAGTWEGKIPNNGTGLVKLWDTRSLREINGWKCHSNYLTAIAFSPYDRTVATASMDHTAKLWRGSTGKERFTLPGNGREKLSLGFSFDGKLLAIGTAFGEVELWDVDSGKQLSTLHVEGFGITQVEFLPSGKILAVAGDRDLQLWNVQTRKLERVLEGHRTTIRSLALSPDGHTMATGGDGLGEIKLWDLGQ